MEDKPILLKKLNELEVRDVLIIGCGIVVAKCVADIAATTASVFLNRAVKRAERKMAELEKNETKFQNKLK